MQAGADPASTALASRLDHLAQDGPLFAQRTGAAVAKLLAAGPAFVGPDLVQNVQDRPGEEVREFFGRLEGLRARPSEAALRRALGWTDDGFLQGLHYEADPVAAWQECAAGTLPFWPQGLLEIWRRTS